MESLDRILLEVQDPDPQETALDPEPLMRYGTYAKKLAAVFKLIPKKNFSYSAMCCIRIRIYMVCDIIQVPSAYLRTVPTVLRTVSTVGM